MQYIDALSNNRHVNISYPPELRTLVLQAQEEWKAFCGLPLDLKKQLSYENFGGYFYNDDPEQADVKENLHFSLYYKQKFLDYIDTISDSSHKQVVSQFTETLERVMIESQKIINDFIVQVEQELGQTGLAESLLKTRDRFVIRFLHYLPRDSETEVSAMPHCDIGGFTLHLFQDFPGLQYLDNEKEWQDIKLNETYTSIFPGIQMQHRTHGQVEATCHRVAVNKDTAQRGRYSAVIFNNWSDYPTWDKDKQGRLAEKESGFNYGMTHEELDTLFSRHPNMEDTYKNFQMKDR